MLGLWAFCSFAPAPLTFRFDQSRLYDAMARILPASDRSVRKGPEADTECWMLNDPHR